MHYRRWAPAVLAIPALLLAACGSSTSPSTASGTRSASAMSTKSMPSASSSMGSSGMSSAGAASLEKIKTSIGPVLADSKGLTVYWYAKDTAMSSACTGSCATAWPPLTGKPAAAMGFKLVGKFGTITRANGVMQATYKGHPLYTYAGDMAPGQRDRPRAPAAAAAAGGRAGSGGLAEQIVIDAGQVRAHRLGGAVAVPGPQRGDECGVIGLVFLTALA